MVPSFLKLSAPLARRLAGIAGAVTVTFAVAPSASAWGPAEPVPVLAEGIIQPDTQLRLREDDSAFFLVGGHKVGANYVNQPVYRPPAGPATVVNPFANGFGEHTSGSSTLLISPLDAFGNLLAVRQSSPYTAGLLTPGADPAAFEAQSTGSRISHVDLAPGGEAAAIIGGGSTAGVSFRPAGPGSAFDAPRTLDRAGNQRSYGIGIVFEPGGGVLVVYRTEQERAVLQAYAPPGKPFGPPELIDVPTDSLGAGDPRFVKSTNGHAMLVWTESIGGDTNPEQVWAVARRPGEPLGAKSLVAQVPIGNRGASDSAAGITDDGVQYIAYRDYIPVTGCTGNADGDATAYLAVRPFGGEWGKSSEPSNWPKRVDYGPIETAGNRVGMIVLRSTDVGQRCEKTDPTSTLGVRLGSGLMLGNESVIASESISSVGDHGAVVTSDGFAVNSRGGAIAISDAPTADGKRVRHLHFHSSTGDPAPKPQPKPVAKLGDIKISGKTLKARGGDIPFEAGCVRVQPGDKMYCHITAILLEQERRAGKKATASAKKKAKGKAKKKKTKPKVLARAKRVRVAPGKRGKVTLKLNKLGKKKLRAASKKGMPVVLRVTIKKGNKTQTIERKVNVKVGKAKKGKKKKGKR